MLMEDENKRAILALSHAQERLRAELLAKQTAQLQAFQALLIQKQSAQKMQQLGQQWKETKVDCQQQPSLSSKQADYKLQIEKEKDEQWSGIACTNKETSSKKMKEEQGSKEKEKWAGGQEKGQEAEQQQRNIAAALLQL